MNTILCNDIYANTLKYKTYNVHNDRHNNISEHKTTRIKMIVTINWNIKNFCQTSAYETHKL